MTPLQLTKIRAELGMTQAELAKELGLHRKHISAMETGHKKIMRVTELAIWHIIEKAERLNKRSIE